MSNTLLKANFHTHTNLCDGADAPAEVAKRAYELGFEALGFSGHMDPDIHMDLPLYLRTIKGLQKEYEGRMEILCGIELDILYVEEVFGKDWDGASAPLAFDPSDASMAGLDYRIGSTHFMKAPDGSLIPVDFEPEMLATGCDRYYDGDYYKMAAAYYELEAGVYDKTHCDFVGHFDLFTRFNDSNPFLDESDPRYTGSALTAMEHLVKQGVAFEINCGAVNRGRKKELYPNLFLLKALREFGGEILINSDAHQMVLLDGAFDQAVEAARAAGFDHVNVLTKKETGKLQMKAIGI
ncbi:MAG: histidinol-phosphatase HisJ family protein [Lachnospiraceae bacterium]|nr:histidinol-phosphatase HisJ family protein [Lachnospiraceae bacterium]